MSESSHQPLPPPWLAHYGPGVGAGVDHEPRCLHELLADVVRRHPEREALIFAVPAAGRLFTSSVTFQRLGLLVERFAASLQRLGVRAGDRVAISVPNCPQFVVALLGAARAGAIAVPFNPLYSAREVELPACSIAARRRWSFSTASCRSCVRSATDTALEQRHRDQYQGAFPAPAAGCSTR